MGVPMKDSETVLRNLLRITDMPDSQPQPLICDRVVTLLPVDLSLGGIIDYDVLTEEMDRLIDLGYVSDCRKIEPDEDYPVWYVTISAAGEHWLKLSV